MDIPEGMTVEEALDQQGPMMKVLWESPSGEDIEVPRGMNVASMVEAGLIAPFDQEIDGGEGLPSGVTGARAGAGKPPSGVFDPAAVKGAQERSTEVSELYAKVMANKARAKAPSTASQNGYNGSGVKGEINGSNAWLSGVLGKGQGRGQGSGSSEKPAARTMTARSGHQHGQGGKSADEDEDADPAGMGVATASGEGNGNNEDNENTDGGKEMVGYDFILKDRADTEGKVAQSARASVRYIRYCAVNIGECLRLPAGFHLLFSCFKLTKSSLAVPVLHAKPSFALCGLLSSFRAMLLSVPSHAAVCCSVRLPSESELEFPLKSTNRE